MRAMQHNLDHVLTMHRQPVAGANEGPPGGPADCSWSMSRCRTLECAARCPGIYNRGNPLPWLQRLPRQPKLQAAVSEDMSMTLT